MSPTLRKSVLAAVGGGAWRLPLHSSLARWVMMGLRECDTPLIRMW